MRRLGFSAVGLDGRTVVLLTPELRVVFSFQIGIGETIMSSFDLAQKLFP